MGRQVLEPRLLIRGSHIGPADEVAAHVPHLPADALDIRIERAVLRLVLGHRDLGPVRLVLKREPAQIRDAPIADEVDQHGGELRNRSVGDAQRPALPGDVDRRAGALSELHRSDEGLHAVRIAERRLVEEDPRELGLQVAHLPLHVFRVVVRDAGRTADRRVHVMVELAPVAGEALRERRRLLHLELRRLDGEPARIVLERRLDRARGSDRHGQRRRAELRQRDRDPQHDPAAWADLHRLRRERRAGGGDADDGTETDILRSVPDDRDDEEGTPDHSGTTGVGPRECKVRLEQRLRVCREHDRRSERDCGAHASEPLDAADVDRRRRSGGSDASDDDFP